MLNVRIYLHTSFGILVLCCYSKLIPYFFSYIYTTKKRLRVTFFFVFHPPSERRPMVLSHPSSGKWGASDRLPCNLSAPTPSPDQPPTARRLPHRLCPTPSPSQRKMLLLGRKGVQPLNLLAKWSSLWNSSMFWLISPQFLSYKIFASLG